MNGHLMVENAAIINMVPPTATPLGLEQPVTCKGYDRVTFLLSVDNGNSVSGSAVTLKQGTAVGSTGAMTGDKALGFDWVYANTDTGAGGTLTKTAVTSDTFTTDTTNAKNLLYVIEVDTSSLDADNNFDCIRIDLTDPTNAVVQCDCILWRGLYQGGLPTDDPIAD